MESGKMANVKGAAIMHNGEWLKISDRDEVNDLKGQVSNLQNDKASLNNDKSNLNNQINNLNNKIINNSEWLKTDIYGSRDPNTAVFFNNNQHLLIGYVNAYHDISVYMPENPFGANGFSDGSGQTNTLNMSMAYGPSIITMGVYVHNYSNGGYITFQGGFNGFFMMYVPVLY
ncbi:hypothetical protein [Apilactobacillus timberlakei]|uniref:Uncharacterized protein n=1 Tax=Apilactobacillus timberlakei TaxID=2008380 RepID=A0ABY2YVP3_9LACO|nr:hypothetical protein [Apilactobacillus timberlakei]TPR12795.1 hypothetical protein DY048_07230 [Apilactobacillus timberlakei]TPR13607.1 hypothetical protein DY052_07730 [Apilactobacillus timberlakei]